MSQQRISLEALQTKLGESPDIPVTFHVDGTGIHQGYHVTELKHAQVRSIDCGRHSEVEIWDEITVQLLDGTTQSTQGHMSSTKLRTIVNSALTKLEVDAAAQLFFEFAPDNGPLRKLSVDTIESSDDELVILLESEKALCKPYQRLKDAVTLGGVASAQTGGGCCSTAAPSPRGGCC